MLASCQQLSRRITQNGILEYTECQYDVEEVIRERDALKQRIGMLQFAIDRTNLLSFIEILCIFPTAVHRLILRGLAHIFLWIVTVTDLWFRLMLIGCVFVETVYRL